MLLVCLKHVLLLRGLLYLLRNSLLQTKKVVFRFSIRFLFYTASQIFWKWGLRICRGRRKKDRKRNTFSLTTVTVIPFTVMLFALVSFLASSSFEKFLFIYLCLFAKCILIFLLFHISFATSKQPSD